MTNPATGLGGGSMTRPEQTAEIDRFDNSVTRHGTPSGFRLHQQRGEVICDSCKRAKREYDQRRLAAPEKAIRNRLYARAQSRAQTRLKALYPDDYRRLYEQERNYLEAADAADDQALPPGEPPT